MTTGQYKIGLCTRQVRASHERVSDYEVFLSLTHPNGIREEESTGTRCKPGELTAKGGLGYRWEAAGRLHNPITQVKSHLTKWARKNETVSLTDILYGASSIVGPDKEDSFDAGDVFVETFEIPANGPI